MGFITGPLPLPPLSAKVTSCDQFWLQRTLLHLAVAGTLNVTCFPRSDVGFPVSVQLTNTGGLLQWAIVLGLAASVPTVLSDLTDRAALTLADCSQVQQVRGATSDALQATVNFGSLGPSSHGQNAWVGVWRTQSPGTSDPPIAVAGPFVVDG